MVLSLSNFEELTFDFVIFLKSNLSESERVEHENYNLYEKMNTLAGNK